MALGLAIRQAFLSGASSVNARAVLKCASADSSLLFRKHDSEVALAVIVRVKAERIFQILNRLPPAVLLAGKIEVMRLSASGLIWRRQEMFPWHRHIAGETVQSAKFTRRQHHGVDARRVLVVSDAIPEKSFVVISRNQRRSFVFRPEFMPQFAHFIGTGHNGPVAAVIRIVNIVRRVVVSELHVRRSLRRKTGLA
jgi:hypothetical protein